MIHRHIFAIKRTIELFDILIDVHNASEHIIHLICVRVYGFFQKTCVKHMMIHT